MEGDDLNLNRNCKFFDIICASLRNRLNNVVKFKSGRRIDAITSKNSKVAWRMRVRNVRFSAISACWMRTRPPLCIKWGENSPKLFSRPANLSCSRPSDILIVVVVTAWPNSLSGCSRWKKDAERCLLRRSADFSAKLSSNKCVVKASPSLPPSFLPSQRFSLVCVCVCVCVY